MKLVFFGPPGAGKGTVAVKLAEQEGIPHISTGDLFREAIKNQTELGKKVKEILDSGALVPDEVTVDLVRERLAQGDTSSGYILDGFPRTIPQAEALAEITTLNAVINFGLDDETIVSRLTGRRVCSKCGFSHHMDFLPPKREGICDRCGGELIQRKDDTEVSIRNRLSIYESQTAPLIDHYRKGGLIVDVDGKPAPEVVLSSVAAALQDLK
jgi:adenylate kinase